MKILNWFFVLVGIAGLIAVRAFEDRIFYDPFLEYFHEANKNIAFPHFEWGKMILSYIFRFGLNLFFSAMIIFFWFKNKVWTFQGIILMCIVFVVVFPVYLYCIYAQFEIGYLFSFYLRRFVIQPLILLLIIPMFYYRRYTSEKDI